LTPDKFLFPIKKTMDELATSNLDNTLAVLIRWMVFILFYKRDLEIWPELFGPEEDEVLY
jgi:hypothetical protein